MSTVIVNARGYGSTEVAMGHERTTEYSLGTPIPTGILVSIGSSYAAEYNHGVKNWEHFGGTSKKRRMHGGFLLLNRVFAFLALVGMFLLYICTQPDNKYYCISIIVCAVIYLIVTIWNWYVFRTNGNLLHSQMIQVPESLLPDNCINEFYTIPIHTEIIDRRTLAISNQIGSFIAQLIQQNQTSTSIEIMCYQAKYLQHIRFKKESICHFILAAVAVLVAIGGMMP